MSLISRGQGFGTGANTRSAAYVLNGIQLLGAMAVFLLGAILLTAAVL